MIEIVVRPALIACLVAGAGWAVAGEEAVRKSVDAFIGTQAVESVRQIKYGGLYEVVLNSGEMIYTDAKVSFLIDGRIIDTATRADVTQARHAELATIDFSILPLENAIKQVKGDGKRVVVSFEDPNCGYCKRFAQELSKIGNVTIYTFLYPILGEDSSRKSAHIWCSSDRAAAWNDWMLSGTVPQAAECDGKALDQNLALGRKLRINGTPTVFFEDGRRHGGYLAAAQLEEALAALGK
ncbi:MAG: DsbC family protein [Rhodocyclaceae bacterium]|jgi:thiol:disulfide interchange protein DsbC|nr:DsbC family protein [Rhodocyclaceae bacterium]